MDNLKLFDQELNSHYVISFIDEVADSVDSLYENAFKNKKSGVIRYHDLQMNLRNLIDNYSKDFPRAKVKKEAHEIAINYLEGRGASIYNINTKDMHIFRDN